MLILGRDLPFDDWEIVDVAFDSAGVDVRVPHHLKPNTPYDIYYIPIRKTGECDIHDARDNFGVLSQAWTNNYIVLRSTAGPVRVQLLLFTRKDQTRRA